MKSIDIFLAEVRKTIPNLELITDPTELNYWAQDWSKILTPNASAAVFPTSTTEVSTILKLASQHEIAIVPSGGRTGLSGGAVATQGEVVLSLTKMNQILSYDPEGLTLNTQAGVITEAAHEYLKSFQMTWPVDFASKGSSTIGGNIATNAGGVRVVKYGTTRNWVLGLTAVDSSGSIHHFGNGLEKNNSGPDPLQLLIGSEGTLMVITEAILKCAPLPRSRAVWLGRAKNFQSLIRVFTRIRSDGLQLSAFECFSQKCHEETLQFAGLPNPFPSPGLKHHAYFLAEFENPSPEHLECIAGINEWASENGDLITSLFSDQEKEIQKLWRYREQIAETILSRGKTHQHDVSVPIQNLFQFYSDLEQDYEENYPNFDTFLFGHIGDGNLHIFLREKSESTTPEAYLQECDEKLFLKVKTYQGSVSAEHGIGLLKKPGLPFTRSELEIQLMKRVKKAFDPRCGLNPGKVTNED